MNQIPYIEFFNGLSEGQCFLIPCDQLDALELANICNNAGEHLKREFICVKNGSNFEISLKSQAEISSPTFGIINIVDSTPLMLANNTARISNRKFPFDTLEVGKSFFVALSEEGNLRTQASQYGKKLGRKFRCVKHKEQGLIEVGRIS